MAPQPEGPAQGLSSAEAARRLTEHGANRSARQRPPGPWRVLAGQFRSILLWVLFVAIGLSIWLGDILEAVAIAAIAVFTVVLGFVQEYRAQRAMQALQALAAPTAMVLRDGHVVEVAAAEVVPGDVLVLAQGDIVAADARLVEAAELSCSEAALTGESMPVEKIAGAAVANDAPIGDRIDQVFAATHVARGRGLAEVTATGDGTEVGRIGSLLAQVAPSPTPLERQLARMSRWLLVAGGALIALIMVMGVLRDEPLAEMLIFGVALAVAAVPEALPAVVTISLAIGARRMAKRNALVRRLPTVETLGSTTIICSDKTGTLTTGDMTVTALVTPAGTVQVPGVGLDTTTTIEADAATQTLLRAATLCNDARLDPPSGDPTEIALLVAAAKAGLHRDALESDSPRTDEEPFSAETQQMATTHGKERLCKGSPEAVFAGCRLDPTTLHAWQEHAQGLAATGHRMLAFATGKPGDMTLLGLAALQDPPRVTAGPAIEACFSAGIRPLLITGDHPATAQAIASDLGLPEGPVITGQDLGGMDAAALAKSVQETSVYARVSPEHKLRIVAALQAQGHIVAMTGDGVNDAPALKQADIGVAMGQAGTDVAREAADMTLTDDDFATIVAAVDEGRGIFHNIRKYLAYLLSTNLGELLLIAAAMLLGVPLPLTAVMILYVNLASDGLPALALAVDPHEPDLMDHPPRRPGAGILDAPIVAIMVLGGIWSAAATLAVFLLGQRTGDTQTAQTMALATLVLVQFTMGYSFRTERHSVLARPFANKWYNGAVAWEVSLLLLLIYLPLLQRLFGTVALEPGAWIPILVAVLTAVPILEAAKWFTRRAKAREPPAQADPPAPHHP